MTGGAGPGTTGAEPADPVELLRTINATAAFNRWLGIEVTAASAGEAHISVDWREDLGQYAGFLHAGIVGALIDTAGGFAAATVVGMVLASHYDVALYAPAVGSRFTAIGTVVRAGRRQVFADSQLFSHADGVPPKLVAAGSVVLLRS